MSWTSNLLLVWWIVMFSQEITHLLTCNHFVMNIHSMNNQVNWFVLIHIVFNNWWVSHFHCWNMNCKNYEILSNLQLKRIGEHKYSHSGQTLLDPLMQKYWTWFVSYFPVWLAPNVMTLTGLCVNIITSLILVYYSPDAKQHVSIIAQQKQLIVIN